MSNYGKRNCKKQELALAAWIPALFVTVDYIHFKTALTQKWNFYLRQKKKSLTLRQYLVFFNIFFPPFFHYYYYYYYYYYYLAIIPRP